MSQTQRLFLYAFSTDKIAKKNDKINQALFYFLLGTVLPSDESANVRIHHLAIVFLHNLHTT